MPVEPGLGGVLAQWRFPRLARWPVTIMLGLLVAMFNAGLLDNLQKTLAQALTWRTDLLAGRTIEDPALVTLGVTWLVWWAGYSAAHGLAGGGYALEALWPTTLLLAIHSIYTRQGLAYILGLAFGLIILMAWTAQGKRQADWRARGLDYPTELWPEWMGSGLVVASLACGLALALSVLASQTTLEWMRRTFEPPVARIRQITERMLGGATPPASLIATGDLPTARLVHAPPPLTEQVVMWVQTDEPPLPDPVTFPPYIGWRGMTYAIYTGRGWSNPPLTARPLPATRLLEGNGFLTQRFEIMAPHGETVYVAHQPVAGDAGLDALYTSDDDLVSLRGTLTQYTVVSRLITPDQDTLRRSPPISISHLYHQLPATLPPRVRELALQVTAAAPTPYDQALAIEAFLRTYPYTLDLPPLPENRDLVDYFLFDAPGGYCDYYASAMVVMLRAVGVPARLASGYTRGQYDTTRRAYRVLAADAHAWPEVYLAGLGWVEFEPTAGRPAPIRRQPAHPAGLSAGEVRAAQVRQRWWPWLTGGLAGVLLLTGIVMAGRTQRQRQRAAWPADKLIPWLYQRLRQYGIRLGVETRPSDTPDEFIQTFIQTLQQRAAHHPRRYPHLHRLQQVALDIAQLYNAISYSPHPPSDLQVRRALEAGQALRIL